ncbi:MAG: zinc ribbon domain-containing protein [bacterium]
MYCSGCGSPIAPELSFCNRCGTSLKERSDAKPMGVVPALVTAMTFVALAGMGILLGGALALKNAGQFGEEFIILFLFLTFFIVAFTEIFLYRQLSRLTAVKQEFFTPAHPVTLPPPMPQEFREPQPRALAEPIPSVTENTTRTLEYSRDERLRNS